jgi:hypothetical protein
MVYGVTTESEKKSDLNDSSCEMTVAVLRQFAVSWRYVKVLMTDCELSLHYDICAFCIKSFETIVWKQLIIYGESD